MIDWNAAEEGSAKPPADTDFKAVKPGYVCSYGFYCGGMPSLAKELLGSYPVDWNPTGLLPLCVLGS